MIATNKINSLKKKIKDEKAYFIYKVKTYTLNANSDMSSVCGISPRHVLM